MTTSVRLSRVFSARTVPPLDVFSRGWLYYIENNSSFSWQCKCWVWRWFNSCIMP